MPASDNTRPADRTANDSPVKNSRCARCGGGFHCASIAGGSSCWCAALPNVMPVPGAEALCYCPSCLAELAARRVGPG